MARAREFDPIEVIEKAVPLFWEKGYADTSMDDLVKHTGISRYGIYGEFGNKREFFLRALEHFENKFSHDLIKDLANSSAGLAELREYYDRLLIHSETPDARMGCFLCNTAMELSGSDQLVAERIGQTFESLRVLFANALSNAQRDGDLNADLDVEEYASYLLGVQMSMAMMIRSGFSEQRLKQFIKVALKTVID